MILKKTIRRIFNKFRKKNPYLIYTDGSHKTKWGAWAFVIVHNDKILHQAWGRERHTNSHRMEFQAAIEALQFLKKPSVVILHTDSRVLLNAVTKKNLRAAVNPDQLEILHDLNVKHNISWQWVKAHAGNYHNELCDELCRQARS